MSIISAVKTATFQRKLVKQVAISKGNNSISKEAKQAAKDIVEISGAYSKNPLKNFSSWIKCLLSSLKFDFAAAKDLQGMPKVKGINIKLPDSVCNFPSNAIRIDK